MKFESIKPLLVLATLLFSVAYSLTPTAEAQKTNLFRCGGLVVKDRDPFRELQAKTKSEPIVTEHFTVWNPFSFPEDYVLRVSECAEYSWNTEVNQFGFRAPPDSMIDIVVLDLDIYGWLGVTFFIPVVNRIAIGIDNDIPWPSVNTTVAHEVFHAVQASYDFYEGLWIIEGTATYMMDEVYDYVNDYVGWANELLLDPDRSLTSLSYNSVLYWKYLSEHYGGVPVVRTILQETVASDGVDAVDKALQLYGTSYQTSFIEWTVANYLIGTYEFNGKTVTFYSDDAASRYSPARVNLPPDYAFAGTVIDMTGEVSYYATDYLDVRSTVGTLTISCVTPKTTDENPIKILLIRDSQVTEVEFLSHSTNFQVSNANNYDKIALIIHLYEGQSDLVHYEARITT